MKTIHDLTRMREKADRLRYEGDRIGFVPTMGFLHEGHLSLIRRARAENHTVVVSVFVNPTQFGPQEDFGAYPRDPDRDAELCRAEGVDILFLPSAEEMYPTGFSTSIQVKGLTEGLCGRSRPGHFDGVCTVVSKLFNLVRPHRAYFGLKDYQQFRVISRMVRDLNLPVEVVGLPTVREGDGLALSSRNTYLSPGERKAALALHHSLETARAMVRDKVRDPALILTRVREILEERPELRLDYAELVDPGSLAPLSEIREEGLLLLAVFAGRTRLIDNTLLVAPGPVEETNVKKGS